MVSQPVLDHALLDSSTDLMTRLARAHVCLQESKTQVKVLTFVESHVLLEDGGSTKINNVTLLVMLPGKQLTKMVFRSAKSHAQLDNGGETKTRPVRPPVTLHGFEILPATVFQFVLDHAPKDNSTDLMTRVVVLNVPLQESRIPAMVLISARFHALLDNGGETKTASVFPHVIIHGRLSPKTVSRSAKSHAQVDGGEMKIRPVNPSVLLHGFKEPPLTGSQLAPDHVIKDSFTDLTTTPAVLNALLLESRILTMVSTPATFHALLDNGGEMKTTSVFPHVIIHGRQSLKTAL